MKTSSYELEDAARKSSEKNSEKVLPLIQWKRYFYPEGLCWI